MNKKKVFRRVFDVPDSAELVNGPITPEQYRILTELSRIYGCSLKSLVYDAIEIYIATVKIHNKRVLSSVGNY